VNFVYYSEKTPSQCMIALNERLQTKNAKLEGWVEKSGRFSISVTTPVLRRFSRTTRMQGSVVKENGVTVIRGFVPDGVEARQRAIIFGTLVLVGVLLILGGSTLPGILALLAPLPLNIPLEGDFNNYQILIAELQRTLKAKAAPPTPARKPSAPKSGSLKPAAPKGAARSTTSSKSAALKPATPKGTPTRSTGSSSAKKTSAAKPSSRPPVRT
jgi:hypothetical protein